MLQVNLSPRRETLRFRIERAGRDRTSISCPSPAGEETAANRAMPVRGESVAMGGKRESIGKSSKLGLTACASFAICSPLEISLLRQSGRVKEDSSRGGRKNAGQIKRWRRSTGVPRHTVREAADLHACPN